MSNNSTGLNFDPDLEPFINRDIQEDAILHNQQTVVINRNTGGQVHVQTSLDFEHLNISGQMTSQIDWMRQNAIGVVEFDETGKVIRVRKFK